MGANQQSAADSEVSVTAPAFKITTATEGIGAIFAAVLAVLPSALSEDETVVVAAIAAATLIVLGTFALAAVDIRTRQRAKEAELRYGGRRQEDSGQHEADAGRSVAASQDGDLEVRVLPGKNDRAVEAVTVDGHRVTLHPQGGKGSVALDFIRGSKR